MTRVTCAYAFKSALQLSEIFVQMNKGLWKWVERENDRWADYISTLGTPAPHRWSVKIIIEPETLRRFVAILGFSSDEPNGADVLLQVRRTLLHQLLPSVGACELEEVDDYE